MQLGFVGLGKMGLNMVTRLERGGHEIVAYDRSADAVGRAAGVHASGVSSLEALVAALSAPRHVWVMVPAGDPTESTVIALSKLLSPGDVIIDGGNTNFHDDQRRAKMLADKQLHYVDAGTSGGIWGLTEGYCLMVGGEADICKRLEPIFLTLAPKDGYLHVGDHGAGHYVKMVHNGIEYGMMQAYAEGFELMHETPSTSRRSPPSGTTAASCDRGCSSWPRARSPTMPNCRRLPATSRIPAKADGRCSRALNAASRCRC
jgi:6-phosphogluconate dehydrogenase